MSDELYTIWHHLFTDFQNKYKSFIPSYKSLQNFHKDEEVNLIKSNSEIKNNILNKYNSELSRINSVINDRLSPEIRATSESINSLRIELNNEILKINPNISVDSRFSPKKVDYTPINIEEEKKKLLRIKEQSLNDADKKATTERNKINDTYTFEKKAHDDFYFETISRIDADYQKEYSAIFKQHKESLAKIQDLSLETAKKYHENISKAEQENQERKAKYNAEKDEANQKFLIEKANLESRYEELIKLENQKLERLREQGRKSLQLDEQELNKLKDTQLAELNHELIQSLEKSKANFTSNRNTLKNEFISLYKELKEAEANLIKSQNEIGDDFLQITLKDKLDYADFLMVIDTICFVPISFSSDKHNFWIEYNDETRQKAFDFIFFLLAKSLLKYPIKEFKFDIFSLKDSKSEAINKEFLKISKEISTSHEYYNNFNEVSKKLYEQWSERDDKCVNFDTYQEFVSDLKSKNTDTTNLSNKALVLLDFPYNIEKRSLEQHFDRYFLKANRGIFGIVGANKSDLLDKSDERIKFDWSKYREKSIFIDFTSTKTFEHFILSGTTKLYFGGVSSNIDYAAIRDQINNDLITQSKEETNNTIQFIFPSEEELFKNTDTADFIEARIGRCKDGNEQYLKLITNGDSHILIEAPSGSGKSILLHNIINSLAFKYDPNCLKFFLIDLKNGIEFKFYENTLPHVRLIAKNSTENNDYASILIDAIKQEVGLREKAFNAIRTNNIMNYEIKRGTNPSFARLVVIIDEYQNLFNRSDSRKNQDAIEYILAEGRAFGINLILATQNKAKVKVSLNYENIGIKIDVYNAEKSNSLEYDKKLLAQLNLKGDAIIKSGKDAVVFRGSYLDVQSEDTKEYFKKNILGKHRNLIEEQVYFDGYKKSSFSENNFYDSTPLVKKIFIGKRLGIYNEFVNFELNYESKQNILICGGKTTESRLNLLNSILANIIEQEEVGKCGFLFFDFNDYLLIRNEQFKHQKDIYKKLGVYFDTNSIEKEQIESNFKYLINEIKNRKEDFEKKKYPIYLFFINFHTCEGKYDYNDFEVILKEGSALGIFSTLLIKDFEEYSSIVGGRQIVYFNHRLALTLNKADISKLLISDSSDFQLDDFLTNRKDDIKSVYYNFAFTETSFFEVYEEESIFTSINNILSKKEEVENFEFEINLPTIDLLIDEGYHSKDIEQESIQTKVNNQDTTNFYLNIKRK